MLEYRGLNDPSRLLKPEISENEVELRMHLVTGLPIGEIHMGVAVEPYSQANPRPLVSHSNIPVYPFVCRMTGLVYVLTPFHLPSDLPGLPFNPPASPVI